MLKQSLLATFICWLFSDAYCNASPLLSLSKSQPTETPQVFNLPVPEGFAATERLAFNQDYTEIYFSVVNGYEADSVSRIQLLRFNEGVWQQPVTIVEGYNSPSLSPDSSTLFIEGKNDKDVWVLKSSPEINNRLWSLPQKLFQSVEERHYFSEVNSGTYYYSSHVNVESSQRDFYKQYALNGSKPIALNLAATSDFPRDFFIARDESYLITLDTKSDSQMGQEIVIHFKLKSGEWSLPQSLGEDINSTFGQWKWGFYVTDDNQYLFFTSGKDLSDTNTYWCRFDKLLERIRNTLPEND